MRIFWDRLFVCSLTASLLGFPVSNDRLHAQTFLELRLGSSIPGSAAESDNFPNQPGAIRFTTNSRLTIVADVDRTTKKVTSLDIDGSKALQGTDSGFEGITFGRTTLLDVKKKLNGAGLLFERRPPAMPTLEGGVSIELSYNMQDNQGVVTFVVTASRADLLQWKRRDPISLFNQVERAAKLSRIVLTDATHSALSSGAVTGFDQTSQSPPLPEAFHVLFSPKNINLSNIKFEQLPVRQIYNGPNNFPDFNHVRGRFVAFQSRIVDAMAGGPSFAGEYTILKFSCGTNCWMGFVGNVRTGDIFELPVGGPNVGQLDLQYNLQSRLMVAQSTNSTSSRCQIEFFALDENDPEHWLKIFTKDIDNYQNCARPLAQNWSN